MSTSTPRLSAVLLAGRRRGRAGRSLAALLAQDALSDMEILVLEMEEEPSEPLPGSEHPAVRVLRPPAGARFGDARALAVRSARAEVVAFVEEHSFARPGWATALLAAHRGPYAGVGPRLDNANPGVGRSDVAFAMTYGLFAFAAGETVGLLPGHNSSYKTSVLRAYGERLPRLMSSENVLVERLLHDGHRVTVIGEAVVDHLNQTRLPQLAYSLFHYNRFCAPLRARQLGWSPWRRLAYVLLTPVMPAYFLWGQGRRLRRLAAADGGAPRRPEVLDHPLFVLFAQTAAAVGQAVGLVLGAGDGHARFTQQELNAERSEVASP